MEPLLHRIACRISNGGAEGQLFQLSGGRAPPFLARGPLGPSPQIFEQLQRQRTPSPLVTVDGRRQQDDVRTWEKMQNTALIVDPKPLALSTANATASISRSQIGNPVALTLIPKSDPHLGVS